MSEDTSKEFQEFAEEFRRYQEANPRTLDAPRFGEVLEDPAGLLSDKVTLLKTWLKSAKHCVVMTGAGVSTSAGLPDYRGPDGVWTRRVDGRGDDLGLEGEAMREVLPTPTHRWIAQQVGRGKVKHVISTNVDNLHVRSGLRRRMRKEEEEGVNLSELHGNSFVEECVACGEFAMRDEMVGKPDTLTEHSTDGICPSCGEKNMRDIVVSFHSTYEDVPSMEREYDRAWVECLKADLLIVFGSSLSVPTACDLVDVPAEKGGKVVIVNQQRTPKDGLAALNIFATCDRVIEELEEK